MLYQIEIRSFFKDSFSWILLLSILTHIIVLSQIEWRADRIAREEIIKVDLIRIRRQKLNPRVVPSKIKSPPQKQNNTYAKVPPLSISEHKTGALPSKPLLSIKSKLDQNDFNPEKASPIFDDKGLETLGVRSSGAYETTSDQSALNFSPQILLKENKLLSFGKVEDDMDFNLGGMGDLKKDIKFKIETNPPPYKKAKSRPRNLNFAPKNYIEGEVRSRKIFHKPKPPRLNIERDVSVSLKFTVLPNGEVDRIFPYLKADAKLERAAINLLRRYRFEPLFGSDDIQEGIIHFTIKRKD